MKPGNSIPSFRLWLVAFCGLYTITGCMFQSLSASERFTESSFTLNDAARWGRIDIAAEHVDAEYRSAYANRHQEWGKNISIAEADIVSMQINDEDDTAVSLVNISWYRVDNPMLRATQILQHWKEDRGDFMLVDEEVKGDENLFAEDIVPAKPAAPAAPETSGGAAEEVQAAKPSGPDGPSGATSVAPAAG